MRSVPFTLALITAVACGGRAGVAGDDDTESDGGTLNGGATNGGASNGGATRGGARSSGGRVSSGGAPNQFGGAPATSGGRVSSGGRATNGGAPALGGSVGSGGSLTAGVGGEAGVGGDPGCFYATQRGDNYCISVAICTTQQLETLCIYDPPTALTSCTCFVNGSAKFGATTRQPSGTDLCQLVTVFPC